MNSETIINMNAAAKKIKELFGEYVADNLLDIAWTAAAGRKAMQVSADQAGNPLSAMIITMGIDRYDEKSFNIGSRAVRQILDESKVADDLRKENIWLLICIVRGDFIEAPDDFYQRLSWDPYDIDDQKVTTCASFLSTVNIAEVDAVRLAAAAKAAGAAH